MRRLIESLAPGKRPISWKWIGGMFAFYVLAMAAAASLFINHQSSANLAHEAGATVAGKTVGAHTRSLVPHLAGFSGN